MLQMRRYVLISSVYKNTAALQQTTTVLRLQRRPIGVLQRCGIVHVCCYGVPEESQVQRRMLANYPPRLRLHHLSTQQRTCSSSSSSKNEQSLSTTTTKMMMERSQSSSQHQLLQAFAIGSLGGFITSLAGMGGGFIMIPLMTSQYLLNFTQHQAHGTSIVAIMATGISGAIGYSSMVHYTDATCIAVGGMITARLGAQTTTILSGLALRRALGILMLCIAPLVPAKHYVQNQLSHNQDKEQDTMATLADQSFSIGTITATGHDKGNNYEAGKDDAKKGKNDTHIIPLIPVSSMVSWPWSSTPPYDSMIRYGKPFCIGLCSGYLAGLFGVGGGVLVVPALSVSGNMNHYEALGTSLAAMILPALTGTYTHYKAGHVVVRIAPWLAFGSLVGAYIGGHYVALRTNETTLQWGFVGLMTLLGIRNIFKI